MELEIVIDLIIYKNHYVLNKKLNLFLGNQNCSSVCRRKLGSYTSQNELIKHNQRCEQQEITSIRTSNESLLYWQKHFHKNSSYFKLYADFEAEIEIDNCSICNKTTNIYKQNPVCTGYFILSELDEVLKESYYESPKGYDKVDSFANEIIRLENKMAFYFKNTNKGIKMTEEDEIDYRSKNVCRFCEKILNVIKLEIIVILVESLEVRVIANVILLLHKIKVISDHSFSTNLVI